MGVPTKTILCVDDEPSLLDLYKRVLERAGYRVLTANSGADAVVRFGMEHIDLVVVDYIMPAMDGSAVAAAMKQINGGVPILMVSAVPPFASAMVCVDDFLTKTGNTKELLARVQALLEAAA